MEIYDMESDLINEFDNFSNVTASAIISKLKKGLTHTYIDGTVQEGKYINDEGKIVVGQENVPNTEAMRLIYDFYPKDKGFIERDDKGRYFYFEPLPDFKMNEIKRLEKLRDDAIKSNNEQKKSEALKIENENKIKKIEAEAKKRRDIQEQEAQKKIDEDNKIALEKSKIENETKLKLTKTENDAKNKKIAIISISSLAVLFIGLKLFNKI